MIEEIETKKKNVFMKTYESVNEHFKNLVSKIFDQKTYFSLEKPENPFDGGLDIIIEYGKKKRNIEAMSGGEKSLLIILFIFALHMYRPSQFYILDEVEAALDKENSKKFASLIKDISKNTQMIVVSHNDAVIPYADVALGVTRTDYGSKIVGIKLSEAKTN